MVSEVSSKACILSVLRHGWNKGYMQPSGGARVQPILIQRLSRTYGRLKGFMKTVGISQVSMVFTW